MTTVKPWDFSVYVVPRASAGTCADPRLVALEVADEDIEAVLARWDADPIFRIDSLTSCAHHPEHQDAADQRAQELIDRYADECDDES